MAPIFPHPCQYRLFLFLLIVPCWEVWCDISCDFNLHFPNQWHWAFFHIPIGHLYVFVVLGFYFGLFVGEMSIQVPSLPLRFSLENGGMGDYRILRIPHNPLWKRDPRNCKAPFLRGILFLTLRDEEKRTSLCLLFLTLQQSATFSF